jgi:hypothetical protein
MLKSRPLNLPHPVLVLAFAAVLVIAPSRSSGGTQTLISEQMSLEEILNGAGIYCEKVKQMALQYVCLEKITDVENFFGGIMQSSALQRENSVLKTRRTRRQTYTFDYQLIKKGDEIEEQRIMLEKNGREKYRLGSDLSQLKYSGQYLIFGPVGFLSWYWQSRFTFTFGGQDTINGEPAVIIQAFPNEARLENTNTGRIWINEKFQTVRVELEPACIQNYKDESIETKLGRFKKTVVWTIDYSVEKNGVLFPSQQLIQEIYFQESKGTVRKAVKRETFFIYDDYKYFNVETSVNWKKEEW